MKEKLTTVLKTLHFLSFDVALGAMISSRMFWKLPLGDTNPLPVNLLALGLGTWFVYLADRLLDITYSQGETLTTRHQFFSDHQFTIQVLTLAVGAAGLFVCFFLPAKVLYPGLLIGAGMAAYFFLINKAVKITRFFQLTKELAITVIYTASVLGIPFFNQSSINLSNWILGFCFLLIVLQNLLVFSWFEHRENKDMPNIIQFTGEKRAATLIRVIMLLIIFTVVFLFSGGFGYPNKMALVVVGMSLTLSFLIALPDFFRKNERYRWLGDLVFFYPLLILFG